MPDKDQFDILIIGSGEAGKYLAWTMAKAGRRTVVVERGLIAPVEPVLLGLDPVLLDGSGHGDVVRDVHAGHDQLGTRRLDLLDVW